MAKQAEIYLYRTSGISPQYGFVVRTYAFELVIDNNRVHDASIRENLLQTRGEFEAKLFMCGSAFAYDCYTQLCAAGLDTAQTHNGEAFVPLSNPLRYPLPVESNLATVVVSTLNNLFEVDRTTTDEFERADTEEIQ
jgi:hypothetical protein